jgi:phosphatidylethanolamine/phosphatidyl-N-methylethanolamine N-methyltransferase
MSATSFAREFIKSRTTVGAVLPSSPALAEVMVKAANFGEAEAVLELGPGTGPFTELIAELLRADQEYVGVELNESFVQTLRQRFPQLTFLQGGAQEVDLLAPLKSATAYDCIISGLPWAAFPEWLQDSILQAVLPKLAPGGRFVTFAYYGFHWSPQGSSFRRKLESCEGELSTTEVVWANFPPAFAYVLTR